MRNFVTPIQKPLLSEKTIKSAKKIAKSSKKILITATIVTIGLLCSG